MKQSFKRLFLHENSIIGQRTTWYQVVQNLRHPDNWTWDFVFQQLKKYINATYTVLNILLPGADMTPDTFAKSAKADILASALLWFTIIFQNKFVIRYK